MKCAVLSNCHNPFVIFQPFQLQYEPNIVYQALHVIQGGFRRGSFINLKTLSDATKQNHIASQVM